jgi:hypothetical protein
VIRPKPGSRGRASQSRSSNVVSVWIEVITLRPTGMCVPTAPY